MGSTESSNKEARETTGKTAGIVGAVMAIMLAGKLTGLFRDVLLRRAYGTDGAEAKALALATNIPRNFLDFAFASVISASFIPVFNDYITNRGKGEAFRLADGFVTLVCALTAVCAGAGALFAPQIARAFAPGYSADALALSIRLLRVMALTVFLSGAAFSLTGVLQSLGEFNVPAAMSVISNVIIIVYLLFFAERFGVFGLCAAFVAGWATQALVLIPPLLRRGFKFKPRVVVRDPGMREVFRLIPPVLVGSWVLPANALVNQRVASTLFEGAGAAVIDTANQLFSVITGVFILSVSNVIYPRLAKQRAGGDGAAFAGTIRSTVRAMLFFLIPMTFGLIALSAPLTRLLFEGGRFDAVSTGRAAAALAAYAPGMVGFGLQTILSRGFFAASDGKTPMITGLFAMLINAGLSVVFSKRFGAAGIAAASSCSITVTGLVMLFVMNRRGGKIIGADTAADVVKMTLSGAVMWVCVHLAVRAAGDGGAAARVFAVAAPGALGFIVYMALARISGIAEAKAAFSAAGAFVKRMTNRRGKL